MDIEDIGPDAVTYCETGIAADHMYRMSAYFIQTRAPALPAQMMVHRVLHALLHHTCRRLKSWRPDMIQPEEGYRMRCVDARRLFGLESSNDNRAIARALDPLRDTGLFDHLFLVHDNRWLAWRFRDETLSMLLADNRYALLDASILPKLTSILGYRIHTFVALARRMRKPMFAFDLDLLSEGLAQSDQPWSKLSARVLRALQTCCAHHDLRAFVLLRETGSRRGIDHIEVRLVRAGSQWSKDRLAKIDLEVRRVFFVGGDGHEMFRPAEIGSVIDRRRSAKADKTGRTA
ncbi:hypothetical protein [Seohaeicola zhoushanensis]|uniref:Uncharacterized protein n=1 Tax=Seohaeicola zhoushanensis TaxID=1569283 RepID=A0A8J3H400_9RHOB|nr:hypothetical protein [Seohaeicola zhoushanensis]GHF76451.1 hypothetical protein GCM10017056_53270 [Seohaeicola zhoushanensis]